MAIADINLAIDLRPFSKRNIWPTASGDLAVRPGLRKVLTPTTLLGIARVIVGGFSVPNSYAGEVWHYIFHVATSGTKDLKLTIVDENATIFQEFSIASDVIPRVITHAVVEGEIVIASPDFPTLWGLVGSSVTLATKVASDNPSTTAIDIPRGICTAWNNRVVIADGTSLFFSDPVAATGGSPRTFVAENQNQRPAPVYGIHEGAGGNLIVVTARGVYGLDSSAAAVGIIGSNGSDWRMLNHAETWSYGSSCVVRGRVYALTKRGYMLVDTENDNEEEINDPVQPRYFGPRIASDDFRNASMLAMDAGPCVSFGTSLSVHDLARQTRSWWTTGITTTWSVVGVLKDLDGTEMLLCSDGVYMIGGNFDGDGTMTPAATQPKGVFCGLVPTSPANSPTVRQTHQGGALGGAGLLYFAVRGDVQSDVAPADLRGLIEGTDTWGASKVWLTTPVQSRALDFNINSDDLGIEVATDYAATRVASTIEIEFSKSAPRRKTDRG